MPRSLIIAALCLALPALAAPAAAAAPAPCRAMAAMPGGCCSPAAGWCCLEAAPADCRPLALNLVQRPLAPAPAPGQARAWRLRPGSRSPDAPRPLTRAPAPLYLTHACLLI